jgi:hypothetical protein
MTNKKGQRQKQQQVLRLRLSMTSSVLVKMQVPPLRCGMERQNTVPLEGQKG